MIASPTYRGQPLVALVLVLGAWIAVRAIMWDAEAIAPVLPPLASTAEAREGPAGFRSAFFAPSALGLPHEEGRDPATAGFAPAVSGPSPAYGVPGSISRFHVPYASRPHSYAPPAPVTASRIPAPARSWPMALSAAILPTTGPFGLPLPPFLPGEAIAAPRALWAAAMGHLSPPTEATASRGNAAPSPAARHPSRWSADAWALLRRGGTPVPAGGFALATYGASQAGAVLRYRLMPTDFHRAAIYLRATGALNGSAEREAAIGLSARPLPAVPLVAAAEGRAHTVGGAAMRVRPAAFVYTELPPVPLPHRLRGEFYGQAGYVGGAFATGFVDGQLRVDRPVVSLGRGALRAGGGVWGGAQKGASRLDVGPSATLGVPLSGTMGARLAFDWRFRVAGNAAPASGPALTLSAGF